MTTHRICPLLLAHDARDCYCLREECAWWTIEHFVDEEGMTKFERCAIRAIPDAMSVEVVVQER